MPYGSCVLRHLRTSWKNNGSKHDYNCSENHNCIPDRMYEGLLERWIWEDDEINIVRKRVVVLVDESPEAKVALLWALSHAVNKWDTLTLLCILNTDKPLLQTFRRGSVYSRNHDQRGRQELYAKGFDLAKSFKLLCTAHWPEVHVEIVVIEGNLATTIVSQAKKLEASMLVLGQKRPSLFQRFFPNAKDELVEFCIANAGCLTLGVRKQSSRIGGYVINSRWQKNFWLLA